jgi:hypothetical protein
MPRDEAELIQHVGEWADYNFRDKRAADLGMIEELGEGCHCILKRFQGIRGFRDPMFFNEKFTDALADMVIYLADWCYMHNAFFKFGRNQHNLPAMTQQDERKVLCHILQALASMMAYDEVTKGDKIDATMEGSYGMIAQRMATGIEYWAIIHNIDLKLAVSAAWAKVRTRDWTKQPDTAGN